MHILNKLHLTLPDNKIDRTISILWWYSLEEDILFKHA